MIYKIKSIDSSKDKLIDEKDKRIKNLFDMFERSFSNNKNIIVEKDKMLLEREGIVESKVIEEALVRIQINSPRITNILE